MADAASTIFPLIFPLNYLFVVFLLNSSTQLFFKLFLKGSASQAEGRGEEPVCMSDDNDVTVIHEHQGDHAEDGIDVPLDRINPETLRKMVEEFVTREWSDLSDADCTFEDKIEQVIKQLQEHRIKVVFDLTSETCNIVPNEARKYV